MSQPAQADVVVLRSALSDPDARLAIRHTLYLALQELGHVERVEKYVRDPPDGPYADSFHDQLNKDEFAIIRVIARVIPYKDKIPDGTVRDRHIA